MARAVATFINNREDSLAGVQIHHRKLGRPGLFVERLRFRVVMLMHHRRLVGRCRRGGARDPLDPVSVAVLAIGTIRLLVGTVWR